MTKLNLAISLTLLFFVNFVSVVAGAAQPREMVLNGGFEVNARSWKAGTVPEYWGMNDADTLHEEEFSVDLIVKRSGNSSIRLKDSTHGIVQKIKVVPGNVYNAGAWIKTDFMRGGLGISVWWMDARGKWILNESTGALISHNANLYGTSDWRYARLDNIRAPHNADQAYLAVNTVFGPTSGTGWIDDVSMELAPADVPPAEYQAVSLQEGVVAINDVAFSQDMIGINVSNHDRSLQSLTVTISRPEGKKYWELSKTEQDLNPGERRQISIPISQTGHEDQISALWVTIEHGGKIIYRESAVPPAESAALTWFDPGEVLGNKLYVANDLRTFKAFQTPHSFPGGVGGPKLIERESHPVDLIVELPEGVQATHVVQFINNWRWWNPVTAVRAEKIGDDQQGLTQYRFELPCIFDYFENGTMVFFETDLPSGTSSTGRCWLEWEGGRQPARTLDIEVITVGRMPPFKRLFNGIYYAEAELLLTWLPDIGNVYPQLGLNRLEIDPNPGAGGSQGGAGKGPSRRAWFDQLVEEARKGQLYMATSPSQSTPYFQDWTWTDPDSRALNIDGKPVMDVRWEGAYSLCPLYRGRKFQDHLNMFLNGPTFNEYKLSWLAIDLELWTDEAWQEGCFCSRCLETFSQYMAAEYPGVPAGDPKVFMTDPAANKALANHWTSYRNWCKHNLIEAFRVPLAEKIAQHGGTSGPRPGLLVSEWCFIEEELLDVVSYFEINCYYNPPEVARRLGEYGINRAQGRKNIVAAQSLGQSHTQDALLTTRDMVHNIYEAAAAGVQGMIWYDITSLDAYKLKVMIDACRTIQPFEDIIADGACDLSIPVSASAASSRRVKLGDESLLIVRNYGNETAATVQVNLPEANNAELVVCDIETRLPVGNVKAGTATFDISLEPNQARLVYVGPAHQWNTRTTNGLDKQ